MSDTQSMLTQTALSLCKLTKEKKVLKKQIDLLQESINEREQELLDQMTNEQVDKLTVDGQTVYPKTNMYVSLNKEDKSGAMAWLVENGYEALVTKTVNARTLAATVKGIREDGSDVPETLFNVNEKTTIGIRKA